MAQLLKITHGVDDKITSVDDGVKGIKVGQSLLEHRAQVNAFGRWERTPLHIASLWGHLEIGRLLLE